MERIMSGLETDLLRGEHPVIVATPEDDLEKAIGWFTGFDVHHLPVVNSLDDRALIGIVSTVDALAYVAKHGTAKGATVGQVMVRDPERIAPSTTIAHATQILAAATYQSLPVVDASGHCVGIVTVRDLVK
ncbi:MAG TPA: CBS domain-containing protein, partial [Polyangiaceae bacterium]